MAEPVQRRLVDYMAGKILPPVALDKALEGQQLLVEFCAVKLNEARANDDATSFYYYTQLLDVLSDMRLGILLGPLVYVIPGLIQSQVAKSTGQVTEKITKVDC